MQKIPVSKYWEKKLGVSEVPFTQLNPGRFFIDLEHKYECDECCEIDTCVSSRHVKREECPYCLGSGRNRSCYDDEGVLLLKGRISVAHVPMEDFKELLSIAERAISMSTEVLSDKTQALFQSLKALKQKHGL